MQSWSEMMVDIIGTELGQKMSNDLCFVHATFDDVEVDNDNEHGHVNGAPQLVCRSVCQGFEYNI